LFNGNFPIRVALVTSNSKQKKIRVGTRGSALALRQTELFLEELRAIHGPLDFELVVITTSGDRIQDRFLTREGGKGLFVKEIEEALLQGEADFAVHSCKDMPANISEGLELVAFPKRGSPLDLLITKEGLQLNALPKGAVVGTTSLRRRSEILQRRPDLKMVLLRGNIDTRLRRLQEGKFDAIVLAEAGMVRLGLDRQGARPLAITPAPGQGALVIEARQGDEATRELLIPLHHEETAQAVAMERRILAAMEGDCHLPLGALAQVVDGQWEISVFVGVPNGRHVIEIFRRAELEKGDTLIKEIILELEKRGAKEIIKKCREMDIES
jgi:hydroxymethylbilane synthase